MRAAQEIMAELAAAGLKPEQLALVIELSTAVAVEARPSTDKAAENKRAYDRDYQRERRKNRTTSHDQTTPPKESKSNPPCSEANASGGEPPADPVKQVFDLGVAILTEAGSDEKQARSLIGKWRKAKGEAEVLTALLDCRARSISNPVEWLTKRFQGGRWVSASGHEYRGSDEQVMREAERRNDMATYWAVKSAMRKVAA